MSKRILVVEDQADNRRILRDLLVNAGYELKLPTSILLLADEVIE
jgi:CheY-like chemotaxis protein